MCVCVCAQVAYACVCMHTKACISNFVWLLMYIIMLDYVACMHVYNISLFMISVSDVLPGSLSLVWDIILCILCSGACAHLSDYEKISPIEQC